MTPTAQCLAAVSSLSKPPRSRWSAAVAALLLGLLMACEPVVTVGGACTSREQCLPGQACVLEAPGGFCTRGCTEAGSARECPAGTTCILFGASQLQCAPLCQSNAGCRADYECAEAGGTPAARACRPQS